MSPTRPVSQKHHIIETERSKNTQYIKYINNRVPSSETIEKTGINAIIEVWGMYFALPTNRRQAQSAEGGCCDARNHAEGEGI